jgi:hypothetical protein
MASASSNFPDEESEDFLNDDKVVSIVNLLTKHKVKLWELPDLEKNQNCINEVGLKHKMSNFNCLRTKGILN